MEQENVQHPKHHYKRREPKNWLSIPEVAEQVGYHHSAPYHWIKTGQLSAYKTSGGQPRIMREDLRIFVQDYLEEEK